MGRNLPLLPCTQESQLGTTPAIRTLPAIRNFFTDRVSFRRAVMDHHCHSLSALSLFYLSLAHATCSLSHGAARQESRPI